MLCHCYADRDDIQKVRDLTQQTCFGTFIRRRHKTTRQATHRIVTDVHTRNIIHPDKQLMQSYLSLMSIPETSFHAETGKGSTWTSLPSFCFITMTWHKNMQLINLSSDLLPDTVPVATALGRRPRYLAAQCSGVRPRGGGHEARPTGQGVSERELENSQAAQAAHP